jgi:hypothetical protein
MRIIREIKQAIKSLSAKVGLTLVAEKIEPTWEPSLLLGWDIRRTK